MIKLSGLNYEFGKKIWLFHSEPKLVSIACMSAKLFQSGFSVHGILQERILEWVAMPSSRESSPPRDQTCVSLSLELADGFFTTNATWEASLH